ncbi:MAG: LysR family transcriptional regulator [Proteobacteria bacterium]|jgi:predicted thioesterase|nr:MAG: LysR family transcriptional regulator [Pseudomonadota bacterium]
MSVTLKPGLTTTRRIVVDKDRTISFMGDEGRVYATPELVRDIEITCRDFLLGHIEPGKDSVGTRVAIDHLAATPLGMAADITVTIAAVDGPKVTFEVSARDPLDAICKGSHERFVVDVEKTQKRLKAKLEKAAAL